MREDLRPEVRRQLGTLRRREGNRLERIARWRVEGRAAAVAVVDEAFAELLEEARGSGWTVLPAGTTQRLEERVRELAHNRVKRDHRRTKRTELLDGTTIENRLAPAVEPAQEIVVLDANIRAHLTPEQRRLYQLLQQGCTDPQIADGLGISERTVQRRKAELRSMIKKLLDGDEPR